MFLVAFLIVFISLIFTVLGIVQYFTKRPWKRSLCGGFACFAVGFILALVSPSAYKSETAASAPKPTAHPKLVKRSDDKLRDAVRLATGGSARPTVLSGAVKRRFAAVNIVCATAHSHEDDVRKRSDSEDGAVALEGLGDEYRACMRAFNAFKKSDASTLARMTSADIFDITFYQLGSTESFAATAYQSAATEWETFDKTDEAKTDLDRAISAADGLAASHDPEVLQARDDIIDSAKQELHTL